MQINLKKKTRKYSKKKLPYLTMLASRIKYVFYKHDIIFFN